jgi:AAA15 family ATPase/GTPase
LIEDLEKDDKIIYRSDLGMVMITKVKKKYEVEKVVTLHKSIDNDDVSFDLVDESDGTQRLLDLIPAFDSILHQDATFIIDEIDQSLHPAILRSLIHKIMADETTKGQFVFSTHESNLLDLDIFRQDEIWFAEKDKVNGSTQLYSLSDFKPRYDLDIRKGYLNGRFGAIPFLTDLNNLNWNKKADAQETWL